MNPDDLQRALLDPTAPIPAGWPAGALGVLLLFLIPVGGGIPAGVLMAHVRGIGWPIVMGLYLVSDVILACIFEPPLRLLIAVGRYVPVVGRLAGSMRAVLHRTTAQYGTAGGPLALILVSFGVDPMTGRAAAAAAGHGFVPGWAIAITGDMFYFTLRNRGTNYISPNRPPMAQNVVGGTDQWGDWDRRHRHGRGRCAACWHGGSVAG
jgi:hypothetical protein